MSDNPKPQNGYLPFHFGRGDEVVLGTVRSRGKVVVVTDLNVYLVQGGESDDLADHAYIYMVCPL